MMNTILFQAFLAVSILTMLCLMIYLTIRGWNSISSHSKEQTSQIYSETRKTAPSEHSNDVHIQSEQVMDIDDYKNRFLLPVRFARKTAFTMNIETLEILRNVLHDLDERVTMAAYIENILRQHLSEHRELLNAAADAKRRTQTITI